MTPFAELPQWMDLGPDEDFSAPTADIVGLLKKRMKRKPEGGAGAGLGNTLGPGEDMMGVPSSGAGMESL